MAPCDDNVLKERATAGEIVEMDRAELEDYAWRRTCECNQLEDQYNLLLGRIEHVFSFLEDLKFLAKNGKNPKK